jgi:hypothetical protein
MNRMPVLLAVVALAGAANDEDANKKDMEKMQGDWAAVSMVRDGMPFPKDDAQSFFRTVKGDIDVLPEGTDDTAKSVLGIYEFDGDVLKVCFAAAGKERPTAFESKEGSGHALTVWEREKKK